METKDLYAVDHGAFGRLREAPVSIDDLIKLIDCTIASTAYAIIRGSPWDDETEDALNAVKLRLVEELAPGKAGMASQTIRRAVLLSPETYVSNRSGEWRVYSRSGRDLGPAPEPHSEVITRDDDE